MFESSDFHTEIFQPNYYSAGYYIDHIKIIPYNHWKKDCEWMVMVYHTDFGAFFVQIHALTAEEACQEALKSYKNIMQNEEEDERGT